MKNADLFKLQENLKKVSGDLRGDKVNYAIIKNEKHLEEAIRNLRSNFKIVPGHPEYQSKLTELRKKSKEAIANLKIPEEEAKKTELENQHKKDIADLEIEYKEVIEKLDIEQEKWEKLLDDEAKFNVFLIRKDEITNDISRDNMKLIFDIIDHDNKIK